jgi:RimJ/RimL family protein N-acetyltransferase
MIFQKTSIVDKEALHFLYLKLSLKDRGIARTEHDITEEFIVGILNCNANGGLGFVAYKKNRLVAEIHGSTYGIHIFKHIICNITIIVDPDYQAKGYGKAIFNTFLEHIETQRPDILRVELETRASNLKSIGLYESLGFKKEGIMHRKTRNSDGNFEDSILYAWFNPAFIG